MTISSIIASSPIDAVKRIGIIGVGGVTSAAAYKRMREAGATAVACATALGINGVGIFEKLLDEDKIHRGCVS
jgi:dihydroorotate dehydrogenase (fumarate)